MTDPKTTNPIDYVEVRIEQLKEEYAKNPSEENAMIFDKAVMELMTVLDLLKRQKLLSMNPYGDKNEQTTNRRRSTPNDDRHTVSGDSVF